MRLTRKSFFLNIFWSTTAFIAGIIRGIFLIPLFLRFWEAELYGYYIVLTSLSAYLVYVFDGYTNFSANEYNLKFYKDKEQAYSYLGSGLKFFILTAVVSMALLVLILQLLPLFATTSAPLKIGRELEYCMYIIAATGFIHCAAKYIGSAIIPTGKIYITQRFFALYVMLETMLWVILAVTADDMLVFSTVLNLFSIFFVIVLVRKYSFYGKIFNGGRLREGYTSFKRSLHFIFNNFFERFTGEGLILFVSGLFRGTYLPQSFASVRTMGNVMLTGGNTLYSTFTIEYQRQTARRNGREIINLFNGTWLIVGLLLNFALIVFYPLLDGLYLFWTRYKLPFDPDFFYCILSSTILSVYGFNILLYLKSLNLIKPLYLVSVTRAVTLTAWILIFPKTLIYIGYGLLITEFLINVIVLNIILQIQLAKLECEDITRKIFWNVLPYIFTALFVLFGYQIDMDNSLKMIVALTLLSVIYYFQIGKTGNETLVIRFQLIKHKILSRFKN